MHFLPHVASATRSSRPRPSSMTAGPSVIAPAEELHGVGHDLDGLALAGAVLGLPLAPLQAAVDRDGAALREVLGAVLALLAPDGHIEIVRLVDPFARRVLAARVAGHAQAADGGAAGQRAQLGVAGQIAREDDAVDVGGGHGGSFRRPSYGRMTIFEISFRA